MYKYFLVHKLGQLLIGATTLIYTNQTLAIGDPKNPSNTFHWNLYSQIVIGKAEANWNTAADVTGTFTPNILSELTFDDIESTGYLVGTKISFSPNRQQYFFDINTLVASLNNGEGQDSDFLGDNRSQEFSRSRFAISGDNILGFDLSFGIVNSASNNGQIKLGLLIGYQQTEQDLELTNGFQLISDTSLVPGLPVIGPISGLNSRFLMQWKGPWIGLNIEESVGKHQVMIHGRYLGWSDYQGEATWNLRTDLRQPLSFQHDADAEGFKFDLIYKYQWLSNLFLVSQLTYTRWQTDSGLEQRFFTDNTIGNTRLNEANWEDYHFSVGLDWKIF